MASFISTNFPGVRYREHKTRKHGVGRDKYFVIRYTSKAQKKQVTEALGWASQGMTARKASTILGELQENIRLGRFPQSIKEMQEAEEQRRQDEARRLKAGMNFSDFFNKYYLPFAKGDKPEKTWKNEESTFRNWISPSIGNRPLNKISPIHIERIKADMKKAGRAGRTIEYCLAVIRQVFNHAIKNDYFSGRNPVLLVKIPKYDNRRIRFFSFDEAERLLKRLYNSPSDNLYDMSLVALDCGLRAGECFNLTWPCINFELDQILIKDPKSKRNRYLFMTDRVKRMLLERKERFQPSFPYLEGIDTDLVFINRKGKKVKEISNAFSRIINLMGFNEGVSDRRDRVTFHTLRHTFASWHVQAGVPLNTVKELMGHSTIAMTERYSHLAPENRKEAIKKVEARRREAIKAKDDAELSESQVIPLKH